MPYVLVLLQIAVGETGGYTCLYIIDSTTLGYKVPIKREIIARSRFDSTTDIDTVRRNIAHIKVGG